VTIGNEKLIKMTAKINSKRIKRSPKTRIKRELLKVTLKGTKPVSIVTNGTLHRMTNAGLLIKTKTKDPKGHRLNECSQPFRWNKLPKH
jgi:translation initiation factor 6 (eIF-6)